MFVLIGVTIWYAYSTHKLVQQNTIVISVQKQIDKYEQANLKPVQDIKEKIWYNLASESVKKVIEKWQGQAEKLEKW